MPLSTLFIDQEITCYPPKPMAISHMTEIARMKTNIPESTEKPVIDRIMALKEAPLETLKAQYGALFGEESPCSNNKTLLWRKIAWRLQEIKYGGLSSETQSRIHALIEDYDPVNNKSLRPSNAIGKKQPGDRDKRLPIPGAIIRKEYKGQLLEVKVLENGFEYKGQAYKTLSAVAKVVTGVHWNGYLFFKP